MDNGAVSTLLLGGSEAVRTLVNGIVPAGSMREYPFDLNILVELPADLQPACIICENPPADISSIELAQMFRANYPNAVIYFVTEDRKEFDRKTFKKNGFTDAFLMPVDRGELSISLRRALVRITESRTFRAVKLIDLSEDTVLDFQTYVHLPLNNKHICFSNAGRPMTAERLNRLRKKEVGSMLVDEAEMSKFYNYTATRLRQIGASEQISATEKREKMESAVRDLMGGLFNEASKGNSLEKGRGLVTDCQQIVRSYIVEGGGGKNDWYDKILALGSQEEGTYGHLSNVATFASLFSMGLGIGDPEHLAMAGLLHDVGLIQVPEEIQLKELNQMTPEELAAFQRHPRASVDVIKNWRMNIPEIVTKAIMQHHERFDGSGYPEKLSGGEICPEAQILGIADEFDELVTGKGGVKMTPSAAMRCIISQDKEKISYGRFDPSILLALGKIIPCESEAA
ncbi:MAG: HD domain-containing protein [Bdellovibrionales bacterium]|nr:HD domain-containing protein [Bdellovibrionales bacterium]